MTGPLARQNVTITTTQSIHNNLGLYTRAHRRYDTRRDARRYSNRTGRHHHHRSEFHVKFKHHALHVVQPEYDTNILDDLGQNGRRKAIQWVPWIFSTAS